MSDGTHKTCYQSPETRKSTRTCAHWPDVICPYDITGIRASDIAYCDCARINELKEELKNHQQKERAWRQLNMNIS